MKLSSTILRTQLCHQHLKIPPTKIISELQCEEKIAVYNANPCCYTDGLLGNDEASSNRNLVSEFIACNRKAA